MANYKHCSRLAIPSSTAAALAIALAAFGCTTNRTPGNGEPLRGGPAVGGTSAPITGSSGGTAPVPPPQMDRLVTSADEAARILAPLQAPRGKVLGPVNPAATPGRGAEAPPTGRFVNPAVLTNPQLTVNSSISSPGGTPVVAGGAVAVDGAEALFADPTVAPVVIAPATATQPAPVVTPSAVTPTAAAIPVTPGMVAGATAAPTAASSGLTAAATATAGAPPATATVGTLPAVTAATSTTVATPVSASVPFGGRAAALAQDADVPLSVATDNSGTVVVSNQGRTSRFGRLMRALRVGGSTAAPVTSPRP